MICDMPIIKGTDGWLASGMHCNGAYETPDKAVARKKKHLLSLIRKEIEKETPSFPKKMEEGLNIVKAEIIPESSTARYTYVFTDVEANNVDSKKKQVIDFRLLSSFCSNKDLRDASSVGIKTEYVYLDKKNNPLTTIVVSEETCAGIQGQPSRQ